MCVYYLMCHVLIYIFQKLFLPRGIAASSLAQSQVLSRKNDVGESKKLKIFPFHIGC